MGVSTSPGQTALTRMPSAAWSSAIARVSEDLQWTKIGVFDVGQQVLNVGSLVRLGLNTTVLSGNLAEIARIDALADGIKAGVTTDGTG